MFKCVRLSWRELYVSGACLLGIIPFIENMYACCRAAADFQSPSQSVGLCTVRAFRSGALFVCALLLRAACGIMCALCVYAHKYCARALSLFMNGRCVRVFLELCARAKCAQIAQNDDEELYHTRGTHMRAIYAMCINSTAVSHRRKRVPLIRLRRRRRGGALSSPCRARSVARRVVCDGISIGHIDDSRWSSTRERAFALHTHAARTRQQHPLSVLCCVGYDYHLYFMILSPRKARALQRDHHH